MNTDDSDRGSLRDRLPTVDPPPELAARVQQSLASRGLIDRPERRQTRWRQYAGIGAVAASFLFTGFYLGRNSGSPEAAPAGPRYALLLYGGESAPGEESTSRRREYGEWLGRMASNDASFSGEELGPQLETLGSSAPVGKPVVGFFIVSAGTDAEAHSIARTSPHLKHGGSVVLYRVVD